MTDRIAYQGITFDDVLLEPGYSEVLPSDVDVRTQLTRSIALNIPVLSSPMDTVTEAELAIGLAQEGGLGILHKNMTIEQQARQVDIVKRFENGVITDPVTLPPTATVGVARRMMEEKNIGGVPITVDGFLKGILTRRDLRFLSDNEQPLSKVMTREHLVTAPETVTLEAAERILTENKVEKLLLVDENYRLRGLITIRDIDKMTEHPASCKDARGRLRCGAALGVHDYDRAEALVKAGVDVLGVDSAHGHSSNVIETVRKLKKTYAIDVIAGNVATKEGAKALVDAGADAIKVGIGPGSICTTRIISGVGVPQITAVMSAIQGSNGVPVIADGGIRYSGDMTKALAAGAHCVMLGGLLAGLKESPGQTIVYKGRTFKTYRGMGSIGAMVNGSSDRYRQGSSQRGKLVPEGVEGRVPYKGELGPFVYQLVGGLRAGMGYCGSRNIEELRTKSRFIMVSGASVQESHPHDILITQEAPNYTSRGIATSDGDRAVLGIALGLATGASASAQNYTATPFLTSSPTPPAYLPPPIASTTGAVPGVLPINQLNPTVLPTAPSSRYQTAVYTRAPIDDEGGGIIGPPDRPMPPIVRTAAQIGSRTNLYDEEADFIIRTDLPGPERLYDTLKSEAMLREYIRHDVELRAGNTRNLFPEYEPLSRETSLPPRMFPRSSTWAEPNVVCHGRLYFEQPNMERTGWDFGYLSVPLSAGVFCYDLVMFPYHYGTDPCNRYDCNVGKCMPGDRTPFLLYREPWSLSGFAAEATVLGTGFFVFP